MEKYSVIDIFCGCGGLSLGFEMAGFDIALAIDSWEDAIRTYNFNRNNTIAACEDVKELNQRRLHELKRNNNIVGIIGGPPCQGFSTVGTRDIDDPRNKLYLEYCRIVENVLPEFFVLENVKGLLTLANGSFKNDIIKRFTKLGYEVTYSVLNAADFGVPQNRNRVFFVGTRSGHFEFPNIVRKKWTSSDAISDLPVLNNENGHKDFLEYTIKPNNNYQKQMRKHSKLLYNHEITDHNQKTISIISKVPDGGKIKDIPKKFWQVRKYNKAFERMSSCLPSNTVDTGHRNYFHYLYNRVPTVRENARLQSFPDNFIFLGSKTSQYKQVGNAVPPLLSYSIAKNIYRLMR